MRPMARTCRTCPAVLENYSGMGDGGDQCVRCSERSKAVRAAVASEPLPVLRVTTKPPQGRSCTRDGHVGCEHYRAVLAAAVRQNGDTDFCLVCGNDGEDGEIVHQTGCALVVLQNGVLAQP